MHLEQTTAKNKVSKSFRFCPEIKILITHMWNLMFFVCLEQVCTTFCYCRPHYLYFYEVRPPMNPSYIYEIRLIKE